MDSSALGLPQQPPLQAHDRKVFASDRDNTVTRRGVLLAGLHVQDPDVLVARLAGQLAAEVDALLCAGRLVQPDSSAVKRRERPADGELAPIESAALPVICRLFD